MVFTGNTNGVVDVSPVYYQSSYNATNTKYEA